MTVSLDAFLETLPPEEQARIAERGREAVARHMSLRELRKARRLSQKVIAEKLHTNQAGVSKIEKRADLMLSTLRGYVEAAGGSLELVARFPDAPPVTIQHMRDIATPKGEAPMVSAGPLETSGTPN